jgi:hypothetical protein
MFGALTSCAGGDSGNATDPNSQAGISYTLSPSKLTVVQGQSGTVTVTVTRSGGAKGTLTLVVEGLPPELTATFNPASLPDGVSTATLTIAASTSSGPGTSTLSIGATLGGARVNLNGDPVPLTVTVSLRPGVNVTKSGTGSGTVTSTPAGINCGGVCFAQFNPEPLTLTATPAAGASS